MESQSNKPLKLRVKPTLEQFAQSQLRKYDSKGVAATTVSQEELNVLNANLADLSMINRLKGRYKHLANGDIETANPAEYAEAIERLEAQYEERKNRVKETRGKLVSAKNEEEQAGLRSDGKPKRPRLTQKKDHQLAAFTIGEDKRYVNMKVGR